MVTLQSANIVFSGHFNPYLISPEWLRSQKIWTPDEVQVVVRGLQNDSVRFKGNGVEWMLSFERLVIASTSTNCATLASSILELLPHTPVFSTGANFVFQDAEIGLAHPVFSRFREIIPHEFDVPELFKWSFLFHEEDARVEVIFVGGEQGGTFSVNRHRKTESTTEARIAVEKFPEDLSRSQRLVEKLLEGAGA